MEPPAYIGSLEPSSPISWDKIEPPVLFLNPRISAKMRLLLIDKFAEFCLAQDLIGIASSGTTSVGGEAKIVVLSKQGFLDSAASVNRHLESDHRDTWLHLLPDFHVGGLAIWARASVSGARVFKPSNWKWDVSSLKDLIDGSGANLISLVPTQVYDLVQSRIKSPPDLRAAIVGGGSLHESVYFEARNLGWPILPSYGLTECSSQVATASLASLDNSEFPEDLFLLSHVEARVDSEGLLALRSGSLLEGCIQKDVQGGAWNWIDSKINGWFATEDRVKIGRGTLRFLGRRDDLIKILGELVSLNVLEARLHSLVQDFQLSQEVVLIASPQLRSGFEIVLVFLESDYTAAQVEQLVESFNRDLLPIQQVKRTHGVAKIPRTELGKILKPQLDVTVSN